MPSIAESFNQAIPAGDSRSGEAFPEAHVSGPSTNDAEPPILALQTTVRDTWYGLSEEVLLDRRVRNAMTNARLASWEDCRCFSTEADVADAAAVQLINPVDLALDARHTGIFALNQEPSRGGHARADKSWSCTLGRAQERTTFAVLDYKRVGVIVPNQIEDAYCVYENYDQALEYGGGQSYFLYNSRILLQQAVNYANNYHTKYVAFFDWDCLLLLVLSDQEDFMGGNYCFATVVTDKAIMRRALLGFLERAYRAARYGEGGLPSLLYQEVAPTAGRSRRHRR